MRTRYRSRRDALVETLAAELPDAVVRGIPAGLHVTVELPDVYDERAIRLEAGRRGIAFETMADYDPALAEPPTLMLGYGQLGETAVRAGVRELAEAVRAARRPTGP